METNNLKRIVLKDGDQHPFEWKSDRLGRAVFTFCPQFKRGKLVKMTIHPKQQENIDHYYEWEGIGKRYFTIQGYQGLEDPNTWSHFYCKEHKCQSFHLYVPPESKYLWFTVFGDNLSIGFLREKL